LIQSVGVTQRSLTLETTPDTARRLLDVNFLGVADHSARVLPAMVARGSGHLVVLSSVAGHVATPKRAYYAAAKHALRAWADALRAELHGTGVAVTTISPGYIRTGISSRGLAGDGRSRREIDQVDEKGMDVDVAARRMVDAIADRRRELIVGGKETWAILLIRLFPGLVARLLHRATPS
jgi:short-subunit dehydrogenase